MPQEPATKRTIAFFDGQNLYHAARHAFGYTYPNCDPMKLAEAVCRQQGWDLVSTRFYTGVPDATDNPQWNHFWSRKLLFLSRSGAFVFSRQLRYRRKTITLSDPGLAELAGAATVTTCLSIPSAVRSISGFLQSE